MLRRPLGLVCMWVIVANGEGDSEIAARGNSAVPFLKRPNLVRPRNVVFDAIFCGGSPFRLVLEIETELRQAQDTSNTVAEAA